MALKECAARNSWDHERVCSDSSDIRTRSSEETEKFALQALELKWERAPEPCHDYLFYLKRNASSTLIATSTSECYSDHVTEVWSIPDRSLVTRVETPNTQATCLSWLKDDSYVTGGQDNCITLWRDGHRATRYSLFRVTGHRDWIRSITSSETSQWVISGDVNSCIGLWDLSTMLPLSVSILPGQTDIDVNAVIDLAFVPGSDSMFYCLQRSGKLLLADVRARDMFQWQIVAHQGRGSSVTTSENTNRLLTSARGSEIKLWDVRLLSQTHIDKACLQVYSEHKSQNLPLSLDFLYYEKYIAAGSDDSHAYIYETLSGRLVKKVKLGPGQMQACCAEEEGSLSFFVSFYDAKYMGLVDTLGTTIVHTPLSTEQIKDNYSKFAWDSAISKHTDSILATIRSLPNGAPMGNGNWMETVRQSDLPACKELTERLMREYENQLQACTPSLVRDLNRFFREEEMRRKREKSTQKAEIRQSVKKGGVAPGVRCEKTVQRWI